MYLQGLIVLPPTVTAKPGKYRVTVKHVNGCYCQLSTEHRLQNPESFLNHICKYTVSNFYMLRRK